VRMVERLRKKEGGREGREGRKGGRKDKRLE
jgi:hypothetical protein